MLNVYCSITDLNFRVEKLENNGGSDGNSSVAELEVRVETLEGTAVDHETRISTTETDLEGKKLAWGIWIDKCLGFEISFLKRMHFLSFY